MIKSAIGPLPYSHKINLTLMEEPFITKEKLCLILIGVRLKDPEYNKLIHDEYL